MFEQDDEIPDSAYADFSKNELQNFGKDASANELLQITTKVPPAFNGSFSWFRYEERIDEWCDITSVTPRRQGPLLKSRLCGHAEIYKPYLDRDLLRDDNNGVTYFKDTLRRHFIKGAEHTFLWRYLTFMQKSQRRSSVELLEWIAMFEIMLQRLRESWRDLMPA